MAQAQQLPVFKVLSVVSVPDPDIPGTRYHHTIFVQTESSGCGYEHHVGGDVTTRGGMVYETKPGLRNPRDEPGFHAMEYLGVTDAASYPDRWNAVLSSVPSPPQQKAFNVQTMRTEPFKTLDPLTFYEPGEPRRPLVKCTEWTAAAIPALRDNKLLWASAA